VLGLTLKSLQTDKMINHKQFNTNLIINPLVNRRELRHSFFVPGATLRGPSPFYFEKFKKLKVSCMILLMADNWNQNLSQSDLKRYFFFAPRKHNHAV